MSKLTEILGKDAEYYLGHVCKTIDKSMIHVPSKDTVDRLWIDSDRNNRVLCNISVCSVMVVWAARAMCRFFLSTRELSIRAVHPMVRPTCMMQ